MDKNTRDKKGRFVKGICPNPAGRPKVDESFQEWARKFTDEKGRPELERIALDSKHKRQVDVLIFLKESGYGKAPQTLDHRFPDGVPTFRVVRDDEPERADHPSPKTHP